MAISRPFLLALLGAALLGATYFAAQNARNSSAGDGGQAAQQPQSAQPAAQPLSPAQTLKAAFSTDKLKSASFNAKLSIHFQRTRGSIRLSGAFESVGTGKLPKLDLHLRTHAAPAGDFNVGFVSTGDKAWFVEGRTGHQVPQQAWDQVVAARRKGAASQPVLPLPVNPSNWLRNVKFQGEKTIGGVKTEHVSGAIDAPSAVRDLLKAAKTSGQTGGVLPKGADRQINEFVKRAEFDVYVGKDDHLLRRLTGDLRLAVPGAGPLDAHLAVDLTKVGQPQHIAAPGRTVTGLPDNQFGNFSRGILSAFAVSTGADPTTVAASASNSPRRFRRALAQKRKVVLFFSQGAADDKATAEALHALERRSKVLVLEDKVNNVDAYGKLVQQLSVDQAPAVVIVGRSGNARVIQGYVDAGVLRQEVADAR